jgi:hypothetical protein
MLANLYGLQWNSALIAAFIMQKTVVINSLQTLIANACGLKLLANDTCGWQDMLAD